MSKASDKLYIYVTNFGSAISNELMQWIPSHILDKEEADKVRSEALSHGVNMICKPTAIGSIPLASDICLNIWNALTTKIFSTSKGRLVWVSIGISWI